MLDLLIPKFFLFLDLCLYLLLVPFGNLLQHLPTCLLFLLLLLQKLLDLFFLFGRVDHPKHLRLLFLRAIQRCTALMLQNSLLLFLQLSVVVSQIHQTFTQFGHVHVQLLYLALFLHLLRRFQLHRCNSAPSHTWLLKDWRWVVAWGLSGPLFLRSVLGQIQTFLMYNPHFAMHAWLVSIRNVVAAWLFLFGTVVPVPAWSWELRRLRRIANLGVVLIGVGSFRVEKLIISRILRRVEGVS